MEGSVRQFNNTLYTTSEETSELAVPEYEFTNLGIDPQEVRLLKLYPTNDLATHVRCSIETYTLSNLPAFIAISNARGYRHLREPIETDGCALFISIALERFLRYYRTKSDQPILLWVRHACVLEFDPQEQKIYWTRDFSDGMYASASKVIDMHATNGQLIDKGYFEKVFDSRYSTWRKEWDGGADNIVLPSVCPIRLGVRPSIEAPTMDFQYMPLDAITDEIRIMCILPAEDKDEPIIMHVAHCPIRCEVTYVALSYRWGTEQTTEQIVLNGQRKTIRKNLADAIRASRLKRTILPMWIDALSINQDDIVERSRQVRRMGQIYDYAVAVHSYAGRADEETEQALQFITELAKHPMVRFNDMGEFHFGEASGSELDENRIKPKQLAKLCGILYRFLTREYFRRSWILQEIAWASRPTIFAGNDLMTHFGALDNATYNLLSMLTRDPSLISQMQEENYCPESIDIKMLAYPRKLFYFRYLMSNGRAGGSIFGQSYRFKTTSPGFLETLVLARDFECTDPRDHILALWNIARDKTGLEFTPDYRATYQQIYASFAEAWIQQHGSLDILGAVEATPQASDFYTTVPSWCPCWNVRTTASCLVRKDQIPTRPMMAIDDQGGKLYCADGGVTANSLKGSMISFHGKALHTTGIILDQVRFVFEDAPDIPAGTAPKSHWRARYWAYKIEEYYRTSDLTMYSDVSRAAWAMFHGDSVAAWLPVAESIYGVEMCEPNERYACLPQLSRHVLVYAGSYSRTQAWTVIDSVLFGRRPFITENGYMGLAPAYTGGPDCGEKSSPSIAVLAGCSTPVLLEEREDGTYRLLGTCFVQDWMDGEWIVAMMGADSPSDFWEEVKDAATIVII